MPSERLCSKAGLLTKDRKCNIKPKKIWRVMIKAMITHLIECILHLYEMFCHYDSINLHQTCLFLSLVNMIIYNDSTNKIHRFANKLTSLFQFLHILVISYDRSPPINSCE